MTEGPHVLVVDDELQIRRFLRVSLEANGYVVDEAKDGQEMPEIRRLRLDKLSRRMWVRPGAGSQSNEEVEVLPPLSVSQFRLLEALYDIQGLVVSRQDLVAAVWREEEAYEVSEQALDALVRRLRDRIATIDPDHNYVITVLGHGLRLDNPPID